MNLVVSFLPLACTAHTDSESETHAQCKHSQIEGKEGGGGERERATQVGVMIGAGAAKTGLFWMREGGEAAELSLA